MVQNMTAEKSHKIIIRCIEKPFLSNMYILKLCRKTLITYGFSYAILKDLLTKWKVQYQVQKTVILPELAESIVSKIDIYQTLT